MNNKIFSTDALVGTSLMDAINNSGIEDISVFGVCDKQLSCHSCAVNIIQSSDLENNKNNIKLQPPSTDEQDVLHDLKISSKGKNTRMSCQIILSKELDGITVEVNESSFMSSEFNKSKDDD